MKEKILSVINAEIINISELKPLFTWLNTQEITEIFDELDRDKIIKVFRILPKSIAADVFTDIDNDHQRIIDRKSVV